MGLTGIIIALVAIGVWTAGVGLKAYEAGEDAKDKELAPQIAKLKTDAADEKSANAGFAVNETTYKEQIRACRQSVESVKADNEIVLATQAKSEKESAARNSQFAATLARFSEAANRATAPDQQCDAVKKVILDAGTTMAAIDALGLGAVVTTPVTSQPKLTITPSPSVLPKSAIKTLGGAK